MNIAVNASALSRKSKTGVEWYTFLVLKNLHAIWRENDPEVVLYSPKVDEDILRLFSKSNWRFKFLKAGPLWTQTKLCSALSRSKPDLLFSPSYIAPKFLQKNIQTVTTVHGLENEYFPEGQSLARIIQERLVYRPSIEKSDQLIAVSEHTFDDLIKFYRINPEKIKVIKSGPGSFDDSEKRALIKISGEKKSKKRIEFLFLGGHLERKNFNLALQIFSLIGEKTNIPIKMVAIGRIGQKSAETEKLLNRLGSRVEILGYVEEKIKRELLRSAHFLLYPSFYEGFGFPILEAQLNNVIPIVLQAENFREIGGRSVLELIDSKSKQLNIEKILELVKDSEKRESLAQSGLLNAEKYSWLKCAEKTREVLVNFKKS